SGREHRLPLTDFLLELLKQRKLAAGEAAYVFPGRNGNHHMMDCDAAVEQVIKNSGCHFILHDLRRVFLSTAEKLEVPHYVLKKLVNHSVASDVTGGYIVIEVERLRSYMTLISEHFVRLLGASVEHLVEHPNRGSH